MMRTPTSSSSNPTTNWQRTEQVCLFVGKATVVGALLYSGLYATGYYRDLASRVMKYSIAGSFVGLVGLLLHKLNHTSLADLVLAMCNMPNGPHKRELAQQAAAKALKEILGEELQLPQPAYVIAKQLEEAEGSKEGKLTALKQYLRGNALAVSNGDQELGEKWHSVRFISLYVREITDASIEEAPGLVKEAFASLLKEEGDQCGKENEPVGLVLDICHEVNPIRDLLPSLQGMDRLVAITCANEGDEKTLPVLKELVKACPRLVEVSHIKRRAYERLIDKESEDAKFLLEFCEFMEAKQRERLKLL